MQDVHVESDEGLVVVADDDRDHVPLSGEDLHALRNWETRHSTLNDKARRLAKRADRLSPAIGVDMQDRGTFCFTPLRLLDELRERVRIVVELGVEPAQV